MSFLDWFTSELAIDLGTANTLIMKKNKVMVEQPSIIAFDRNTGKTIALGAQAMQMHEKTHEHIKTIRPMKDGVIADFDAAEKMIRGMIRMLETRTWFSLSHRMLICVPSRITEVEKRAVRDSAHQSGAKEVYMIPEPLAAAIGIGIDIAEPHGTMIVDIGGGTSEIAIIALSGIVCDESIRIAGDIMTRDIQDYIRKQHGLMVGERTAEQVKIQVGAAIIELPDAPEPMEVKGRDLLTGIPKVVVIDHKEVAYALDKSLLKLEDAIIRALESAPPELSADLYDRGLHLTGGGALLRGLDIRLAQRTKLPVSVAQDPLRAVARGTSLALQEKPVYKHIFMN